MTEEEIDAMMTKVKTSSARENRYLEGTEHSTLALENFPITPLKSKWRIISKTRTMGKGTTQTAR